MHLLKIKNPSFNLSSLLIGAAVLLYVLLLPASALAATDAQKACDGKGKGDHGQYTDSSNITACEAGFSGGKSKKTRDAACKPYSGDDLDACYFGFGKGACSIDNPNQDALNNCLNANPIIGDLNLVINFLSAGVGIIITGSIIFGGIQYAMAGNDSNAVGAAKKRIQDALIALLAFFFIFGFLDYLITGGLLFN
jgi:hypothetical protein